MKLLLFIISLFLSSTLPAQNSWKVLANDQTVLNTSTENPEKNLVHINSSVLKKKKEVVIQFYEKKKRKGWERTLVVVDQNERELLQQKGSRLKIKNATLLNWYKTSPQIKIYTLSLPLDPDLRSSVRVRRVHLCTLESQ